MNSFHDFRNFLFDSEILRLGRIDEKTKLASAVNRATYGGAKTHALYLLRRHWRVQTHRAVNELAVGCDPVYSVLCCRLTMQVFYSMAVAANVSGRRTQLAWRESVKNIMQ